MNNDTYHKITNLLYSPYGKTNEIIQNDRILYISTFEKENSNNSDCVIDISYGLFEWMNQDIHDFLYDVRQTSYRVIGIESLNKYLQTKYGLVLPLVWSSSTFGLV